MDILQDAVIIAGLAAVGSLWVFSAAGAFHALWDTFGKHLLKLVEKVKR